MHRFLDFLMQRRRAWAVALVSLLIGLLATGVVGEAERTPTAVDTLPAGADSTTVVELEERFADEDASTAIVLFTSEEALSRSDLAAAQQRLAEVAPVPEGAGGAPAEAGGPPAEAGGAPAEAGGPPADAGGPGGAPGTLIPSEDRTAAFTVIGVVGTGATEIAAEVERIRDELGTGLPEGVSAQLTGPAAVQADLAAVFEGADVRLLAATASIVAILLIVTYRSPFLWLIPLLVVGIADRAAVSFATQVLALVDVTWDESTTGILSVLVFGAGTDYALLLISRYRDELRVHEDRYVAMRRAAWRTAEAVIASSTTVFLGLLTLLLSLIPSTRGLGLACAVGILVAAAAALLALPFTLVLFGRWVFWPKTPRVGQPTLVQSRGLWRRVGSVVAARPGTLVVASLLLLGGLASGLTQVETGLSQSDQFLEKPEAVVAAERLAESFGEGRSDPATVITTGSASQVQQVLASVPGVGSVTPTGEADGYTRLDVVIEEPEGSPAARATVEDMRRALQGFDEAYVGGTAATTLDGQTATDRDRWLIIPLILALVIVALIVLLRSIVAPLILVASVVTTYLAALGASWWLFTTVFGFERLDVGVPLFAFLFLVALGVDYNIFLVTRAAEEAREHGPREGMLRALTATGGVITSAGILLAAVFAVLGVLPLVVLAQLGVVICVGVLMDTLLVRTVVVPAIAVKLGHAFWWPRRVGEFPASPRPVAAPTPAEETASVG